LLCAVVVSAGQGPRIARVQQRIAAQQAVEVCFRVFLRAVCRRRKAEPGTHAPYPTHPLQAACPIHCSKSAHADRSFGLPLRLPDRDPRQRRLRLAQHARHRMQPPDRSRFIGVLPCLERDGAVTSLSRVRGRPEPKLCRHDYPPPASERPACPDRGSRGPVIVVVIA